MSRRKRNIKCDSGNAISIEDALSIMVVIFVLFFLFIVPLVNIDRAKLEEAQLDEYWEKLTSWIETEEHHSAESAPYKQAFGLYGQKVIVTEIDGARYIKALSPDGDLTVINHTGQKYISFIVREHSSVVTYRYGNIHWSTSEQEWFTLNNRIDYGSEEFTTAMQEEFRLWTKANRGF
ncbi:hypothetical protein CHISP_2196 [Chitinispirillum alkaliphilum]|nr:hypothetical protein CHISP_2196 [Chitinispirillum alkaliphilum]